MPDQFELEDAADRAASLANRAEENGSKFRSMTYEAGLRDALDWACGNTDEDPTQS